MIEDQRCELPFENIQTRLGSAMILSYYGDDGEVSQLMQRLSHKTWNYLSRSNKLKGFLVPQNILSKLERMPDERLQSINKYQNIDRSTMLESIRTKQSETEMIEFLSNHYPSLYIYIMEQMKRKRALTKYMKRCKQYENDFKKYSLYVHGFFLPWLQK